MSNVEVCQKRRAGYLGRRFALTKVLSLLLRIEQVVDLDYVTGRRVAKCQHVCGKADGRFQSQSQSPSEFQVGAELKEGCLPGQDVGVCNGRMLGAHLQRRSCARKEEVPQV